MCYLCSKKCATDVVKDLETKRRLEFYQFDPSANCSCTREHILTKYVQPPGHTGTNATDLNSSDNNGFVNLHEFLLGMWQESINSGYVAEKVDSRTQGGSPFNTTY